MAAARSRRPLQVFRVGSLLLPSAVAWEIASLALGRSALDDALARALGPLWLATAGALVVRAADAWVRRRTRGGGAGVLDAIDVLTATGSSVAWTGAAAVLASLSLGWASLSLVGLFGLCVLHVVALWTLVAAGGADPWRRASLARALVPGKLVEGQPVSETLTFTSPRIPAGFRLLASGRVGPRWPVSRYALEAGESGGEVILEADLGPAVRGEHEAEPLQVWLQDVLGLCHGPRVAAGAASLTVLPAPSAVHGATHLLGPGGHASEPRAATRLPTEGSLRLRQYEPGDDVRRIHWVRSMTAGALVVRLPDELPPDRPAVRLVLDTFHPGLAAPGGALACRGPDELLDGLVRVWLGVARALVERGVRVVAVACVDDVARQAAVGGPAPSRATGQAQLLGARACWQSALRPAQLLGREACLVVSHRLPMDDDEQAARWVVVPGVLWTAPPQLRWSSAVLLPHPVGSADNRRSRRRQARARLERERTDHDAFRWLCEHSQARRRGQLLARPAGPLQVRLEVLP